MPFKRKKSGYGKSVSGEKFRHLLSGFLASPSPSCNLTAGATAREVSSLWRRLIHFLCKLAFPSSRSFSWRPHIKTVFLYTWWGFKNCVIVHTSQVSFSHNQHRLSRVVLCVSVRFSFLKSIYRKEQLPVLFWNGTVLLFLVTYPSLPECLPWLVMFPPVPHYFHTPIYSLRLPQSCECFVPWPFPRRCLCAAAELAHTGFC